eukprot:GHVP01035800.1.p1 GENE.GHVP01035800.1~~GHVP01035800.1.p1  ORF type:complete len:484 (+),score=103.32 GHVP01035800.1:29-1453(+)
MDDSVTAKFGQFLMLAFPMAAERDIPNDTCQDSELSGEKNISQNSLRFSKGNQKKDTKSYSVTTYAIVGSVIFGNLAFLSLQSAFGANALEFAFPTGGTEEKTSDSDAVSKFKTPSPDPLGGGSNGVPYETFEAPSNALFPNCTSSKVIRVTNKEEHDKIFSADGGYSCDDCATKHYFFAAGNPTTEPEKRRELDEFYTKRVWNTDKQELEKCGPEIVLLKDTDRTEIEASFYDFQMCLADQNGTDELTPRRKTWNEMMETEDDIQICLKEKKSAKELTPRKTLKEMMETIGFYIKKSFWGEAKKAEIEETSGESLATESEASPADEMYLSAFESLPSVPEIEKLGQKKIEKLSGVLDASDDFFNTVSGNPSLVNDSDKNENSCPELHIQINEDAIYKTWFHGGFRKSVYPLFVAIFQSKLAFQRPQSRDEWKNLIDESAQLVTDVFFESPKQLIHQAGCDKEVTVEEVKKMKD